MTHLRASLPIELLSPQQLSFLCCGVRNAAFIGGFGSGKTLIICIKAILLSQLHARQSGIIVSPTYRMLQNTVLKTMRDELLIPMGLWQHCKWHEQRKTLRLPWGSTIIFASADNPEMLRGPNLCWALVDEATLVRRFAALYVALNTRLRHPGAALLDGVPAYFFGCSGTPEGSLDELHHEFYEGPDDPIRRRHWASSHHVITTSSLDNPGLHESFIDQLFTTISEDMRAAHIYGRYVDVQQGKAYHQFSRASNVSAAAKYEPTLPLRLAFDFNKDPMMCTVWQIRGGKLMLGIDEIGLKRSNTPAVCRELIAKYGRGGLNHRGDIVIYGDATGNQATTGMSDFDEIIEYLGQHFGDKAIELRVKSVNPRHDRRLKSVNSKLRNSKGEVTMVMNPCMKRTIRDLQFQGMDGNSKDKKQTIEEETLGHASDTLDYIVDYEFPYQRPDGRQRINSTRLNNWFEQQRTA